MVFSIPPEHSSDHLMSRGIGQHQEILTTFAKHPEKGGVILAGALILQEILQVLMAVGIICNKSHVGTASVARGTKPSV